MDVLVLMGSRSDEKIAKDVESILSEFGVSFETKVASAHRDPERVKMLSKESNAKIFIAIAGLSAALPGTIASHTEKPVIGVPVSAKFGGLDSLLSIAQMPPGVPVACVGVDNGRNAALLAISILALTDDSLRRKLKEYRERLKSK